MENLIRIGEAARILKVDRLTMYSWEKKGIVKPLRDYRGFRFYTQEQLNELIKRMRPKRKGCE
jgi:DNA-binding transcriptional MerR regulator